MASTIPVIPIYPASIRSRKMSTIEKAAAQVPRMGMTLAIIGCGTMGSAILQQLLASRAASVEAEEETRICRFIATVKSQSSALELRENISDIALEITRDNMKAMQDADIVLFAFKPYMIDSILRHQGVKEALEGKLLLSVLVGSPPNKFRRAIYQRSYDVPNGNERFFLQRAGMNIAASKGESMTVLEETPMPSYYIELATWIFSQCGRVTTIAPELFDIASVMSGVSIALLTVAFDGMLDGAVKAGLKRADAKRILSGAMFSMANLLEDEHPAVLRERFSSPKGTTIDGLLSLEEDRVRYAFGKAVVASDKRSKEIAESHA